MSEKKILNEEEFIKIFGKYTISDAYGNINLTISNARYFYNNYSVDYYGNINLTISNARYFYNNYSVDYYGNFTVKQASSAVRENLMTEE